MAKAADVVIATIATLQECVSDSARTHVQVYGMKYVEGVAALAHSTVTHQRATHPRQLPRRLGT